MPGAAKERNEHRQSMWQSPIRISAIVISLDRTKLATMLQWTWAFPSSIFCSALQWERVQYLPCSWSSG